MAFLEDPVVRGAFRIACDGSEALHAVEEEQFDVLLMDTQMPCINGPDVTAELRGIEAGRGHQTPVIAATAHAMKGDLSGCRYGRLCIQADRNAFFREIGRVIRTPVSSAP